MRSGLGYVVPCWYRCWYGIRAESGDAGRSDTQQGYPVVGAIAPAAP